MTINSAKADGIVTVAGTLSLSVKVVADEEKVGWNNMSNIPTKFMVLDVIFYFILPYCGKFDELMSHQLKLFDESMKKT